MAAEQGNKYAVGNEGGRPPMYETPEQMAAAIDAYFIYVQGEKIEKKLPPTEEGEASVWEWVRQPEPVTITGLALYLGFADRQSLYDYQQKPEFSCMIKRARTRVEHEYEKKLSYDKPTGAIFALKNMSWVDKNVTEHEGLPDMPTPQINVYNNAPPDGLYRK